MFDRRRGPRKGKFVERYEYLLIYVSVITTLTLIAALLEHTT